MLNNEESWPWTIAAILCAMTAREVLLFVQLRGWKRFVMLCTTGTRNKFLLVQKCMRIVFCYHRKMSLPSRNCELVQRTVIRALGHDRRPSTKCLRNVSRSALTCRGMASLTSIVPRLVTSSFLSCYNHLTLVNAKSSLPTTFITTSCPISVRYVSKAYFEPRFAQ